MTTSGIILLLIGGVILILAEFILPGMVCGIVGAAMILGAMVLSAKAYPDMAVLVITGEAFITVILICLGLYFIARTGGFLGLKLKYAQNPEDGYVNVTSNKELIGKTGITLTPLRPSGTIEVEGQRLDAVTDGVFADKNVSVRVIEVHGNRIVVEENESV